MKYITETFDQAARRVPELATLSDKVIAASLAQAMELVDKIPGYSLVQYVAGTNNQPPLFVFREAPLPEASPATKGQCNDERACGACFSDQGQCEVAKPAPSVTPADVEAAIASEHYFTGAQGDQQAQEDMHDGRSVQENASPLNMITTCTLVTKNGHSVVGVAYCADPARFNAQTGRDAARADAIRQLWPMVIYAERERLTAPLMFPNPIDIMASMSEQAKSRTSPENVADVLFALAAAGMRNAPDLRPASDAQGQ